MTAADVIDETNPLHASPAGNRRKRGVLLLVALAIRVAFAYPFFGSIDLVNSIDNTRSLLGGLHISIPYVPIVIPALIRLGGVVNAQTLLPLAFCYKLVPILFDALLAVLIYDMLRRRTPRVAFAAGLLYACSPVAIIVTCLHSQWESIALFFLLFAVHLREDYAVSRQGFFCYGLTTALALLTKPFTAVLLPAFFKPPSAAYPDKRKVLWFVAPFIALTLLLNLYSPGTLKLLLLAAFLLVYIIVRFYRQITLPAMAMIKQHWPAIVGLLATVLALILAFMLAHLWPASVFSDMTRSANGGVQRFGLPFSAPLLHSVYFGKRFWILGLLMLGVALYYAGRLKLTDYLLFIFAVLLGVTGLCPQYLLWIIPLLLVTRRFSLTAGYQIIATIFLLLYYLNPFSTPNTAENMSTLATLRGWAWLMPSSAYTTANDLPIIHLLGNYLLPLCGLLLAIGILANAWKDSPGDDDSPDTLPILDSTAGRYLWTIAAITALAVAGIATCWGAMTTASFDALTKAKIAAYAVMPIAVPDAGKVVNALCGVYPKNSSPFNVMTLFFILTTAYALYAWQTERRAKRAAPEVAEPAANADNEPVSLVMLAYNEAETIEDEVLAFHRTIIEKLPGSEFIVAEDGSTDGTTQILRELQQRLGIIHLHGPLRKGYRQALVDAVAQARHPYVFFSDTGLKHDPQDFWALYPYRKAYDLILGRKTDREDQWYRQLLTTVYNWWLRCYFHQSAVFDADSGFRLFNRRVARKVIARKLVFSGFVGSEIVLRSLHQGLRYLEVPVSYRLRQGTSRGLPLSTIPREILKVWRNLKQLKREFQD